MREEKEIYVYADWQGLASEPVLMGVLNTTYSRGKEIFSFHYDEKWLATGTSLHLDPDLQFYTGRQYAAEDKLNFGMFLDSSPDRWGRVLMKRREAIIARKEGRKPVTLQESDFLLGVYDELRMGGIRFKTAPDGPFLSADTYLSTPPWTSLRELEQASLDLEQDDYDDEEALKWLNMLMAPGSSLGGARPKASVRDPQGNLWIAKFPSGNDDHDIGAWEAVALSIARQAGVEVSEFKRNKFSSKNHTFLNKRFDRVAGNGRIHFASAMTLLGQTDGADASTGVSYLDLCTFISQHGATVAADLQQLWTRIVVNICIKNTDDHLRNHGFLLTDAGWKLSPAYDINPVADGTGLTLNINEDDNSLDLSLALSVIGQFRISRVQADTIIAQVQAAVAGWKTVAKNMGISKREMDIMESAFIL